MKDEKIVEPLTDLWRRLEDIKGCPLSLSFKDVSPVMLVYVEEEIKDE